MHLFFHMPHRRIYSGRKGKGLSLEGRADVLRVPAPAFLSGVLTAVIVTFFQTRMAFSWVLKFKFDRISPLRVLNVCFP